MKLSHLRSQFINPQRKPNRRILQAGGSAWQWKLQLERMDGCGSSSKEKEDAEWKAAIKSMATASSFGRKAFGPTSVSGSNNNNYTEQEGGGGGQTHNPRKLNLYQVKGAKHLDQILEKNLVMVREDFRIPDKERTVSEGGIQLFKHSPVAVISDHTELSPKIKSAALDGAETKGGGIERKAEMEEERVTELKTINKEICLPSIDREMQNLRRAADMDSSSSEEEDAEWKAAIESIAATTNFGLKLLGSTSASYSINSNSVDDGEDQTCNPKKLKHYHIKGQKLLDEILEENLMVVRELIHVPDTEPTANEGGVQLFKHSPVGIVFDQKDELKRPIQRPRILPGLCIDEKSKKFKRKIQSVAVDGLDIIAAAKDSAQKSLAKLEAKEAARKEKAKKEEERIAELKRIRGERWLPSISREMQLNKKPR